MTMALADVKDIATIAGVLIALFVYVKNSRQQRRTDRFDKMARFMTVHRELFDSNGYIMCNVRAMIDGTYQRDHENPEMEKQFHQMLLNVERLAILHNAGAASRELEIYMFGWYAKRIIAALSKTEYDDLFWELAIQYLKELVADAQEYELKPLQERRKNWTVA
jgi:hypothetical protein